MKGDKSLETTMRNKAKRTDYKHKRDFNQNRLNTEAPVRH